jgi:cell wall-associated NlpC family hydrolase
MTGGDVEILSRAHALFAGAPAALALESATATSAGPPRSQAGVAAVAYRGAAALWRAELAVSRSEDAELARILTAAGRDHRFAHLATAAVLAAARADAQSLPPDPIAARELLRRRAIRLRTQQRHVLAARRRARRRRAALLAVRYRSRPGRIPRRFSRRGAPADVAVRAALSRLGRPYVWGATGPDRFDCSGLVKWAYAQAGVRLHRTTFEQIHDGVPVAPGAVRAGDLVFPHPGHVQLAIGGNLVVEAPYAGATVQISRLGENVAIRRPA